MAFNFSPKAVTDGLVLYLDAANTKSYVSGSTTWNDLSRGGTNATLIDGPTFSSANGGAIVLDGVNDYVATSNIQTTSNFTYDFIFDTSNLTNSINELVKGTAGYGGQNIAFHSTNSNILVASTNNSYFIYFTGYNWFTDRGLHNYTITMEYTATTTFKLYVDGVLRNTRSESNFNNFLPAFNSISYANGTSYSAYLFRLYNRTLSAQEVLQNYNATKARYRL